MRRRPPGPAAELAAEDTATPGAARETCNHRALARWPPPSAYRQPCHEDHPPCTVHTSLRPVDGLRPWSSPHRARRSRDPGVAAARGLVDGPPDTPARSRGSPSRPTRPGPLASSAWASSSSRTHGGDRRRTILRRGVGAGDGGTEQGQAGLRTRCRGPRGLARAARRRLLALLMHDVDDRCCGPAGPGPRRIRQTSATALARGSFAHPIADRVAEILGDGAVGGMCPRRSAEGISIVPSWLWRIRTAGR